MSARQLIIAGRNLLIGEAVARSVAPEWQAAALVMSPEEVLSKVPSLAKEKPISAIAFGGGYDDEVFGQIFDQAKAEQWPAMSWLRPDPEKKAKNFPGFANDEEREAYGGKIGVRVKKTLEKLENDGKLGHVEVTFY